ncbi:MAG TPA: acyl-CoA dehydrogenase family protein [Pseudonocardiaceae bacterium]|jgi:alkylation response protein AidB-like acyl-CoA dehydrogenase
MTYSDVDNSDVDTDEVRDEFRSSVRAALRKISGSHAPVWQNEAVDASAVAQAASLGWTGLLVDDRLGGAGAGMLEAVIVAEELGAHLSPLPFLSNAVLAVTALSVGGSRAQQERWLPGIASGELRATVALTGPGGRPDLDLVDVRASEDRGSLLLSGEAGFVLDADGADLLIVGARSLGEPLELFAVENGSSGIEITELLGVDRTRRVSTVVFRDVRVDASARLPFGGPALDAVRQRASVALAADATGAARRALDMAVEYAKQRVQFGRPIGSFQAIKHKLADMYLLVQGAVLAVEGAARALDEGLDASRLVAVAGSYAYDAATTVTGDAIQVHGGIGYTWEHDCHRLFKRTKFDELYLGDPATHRETLARQVFRS